MLLTLLALLTSLHVYAGDFALKDSLADFKKQTGAKEKYLAAVGVHLHAMELGAGLTKSLTAPEQALYDEASALLEQETKRLKLLQETLTPADIQEITKGNPQSIYLRTGQILLFQDFQGCTDAQYKKLKDTYSVADLYRYGIPAMAFVPASELLHDKQYKLTLQKLLTSESRLQSFASLAQTSLNPNLEAELRLRNLIPFSPIKESERQAEVERFRQSLVRAGLGDAEANDYALTMAAKSPECLSQMNRNFLSLVRADFAHEQVTVFGRKYVEKMKRGTRPENVSELTDVKDPYLRSYNDPWGNRLVIYGGRIVSPGEDRKLDTPDDIRSDLL